MPEWDAQIEVDEDLARALISEHFPQLNTDEVTLVGEGWDNSVWATADRVAFRFPRREIALPGVRREMTLLPWLGEHLPVPIPDARYGGTPTPRFPWPWFGSELIDGRELPDVGLGGSHRTRLASGLGRFLRALHGLEPPGGSDLAYDPNARGDMTKLVPRTRAVIGAIAELWPSAPQAEPILDAAAQLLPTREAVLSHGDLHVRHLLISEQGDLRGVIDWGDICLAPRSVDLMLLWSLFSPTDRHAFLAAYGQVDADTLLRSRVLALRLGAMLGAYAVDTGMEALAAESLRGLDRTLVD